MWRGLTALTGETFLDPRKDSRVRGSSLEGQEQTEMQKEKERRFLHPVAQDWEQYSRSTPTPSRSSLFCLVRTLKMTVTAGKPRDIGWRCCKAEQRTGDKQQARGTSELNNMVLSSAIFITLLGLLFYLHFVKIDQETLLVIGSLGIQMTSFYASGKESTTFIEISKVKDIVINEAIYMQKVIYYLCILLRDPVEPNGVSEVVPVFQSSKPRLDCLVEVYKSCQEILGQGQTQ